MDDELRINRSVLKVQRMFKYDSIGPNSASARFMRRFLTGLDPIQLLYYYHSNLPVRERECVHSARIFT